MQVSTPNNVKIYNLSAGKSLPEWLSVKQRKLLLKQDTDIRRRIELIQDFEMPDLSNRVRMSQSGQFIMATGIYKPRVRCFDVNQLSMKFERCFDSEVETFEIISSDYSKIVFLHNDRYVEIHDQIGKYYRLRLPRFGRDMKFHSSTCDMYFVGSSNEVYRLNLEEGRFLKPLETDAVAINVCDVNPDHSLFVCGTTEGKVEAWDYRYRKKVGVVDCALSTVTEETNVHGLPEVSALRFRDGLTLGVGTSTGQILLYDIRSSKPFLIKDHFYGIPIKDIHFSREQDLVLSMDNRVVKMWEKVSGKLFTYIESSAGFNEMCIVPDTGLMFFANEDVKMSIYYIPSLGAAPRWCSFLDSLTEELEESSFQTIYDDYKFVTSQDLEDLGLSHLIGSNMLRGYMHGYFMDVRLYRKAVSVSQGSVVEDSQKRAGRTGDNRPDMVKLKELPKVNRELALKFMDPGIQKKLKGSNLLEDERFKELWERPEFEVDKTTDEYRLLNPLVTKLSKPKKQQQQQLLDDQFVQVQEMVEDEQGLGEESDSSDDDDRSWVREHQLQHKLLKQEKLLKGREDADETGRPRLYVLKPGEEFHAKKDTGNKIDARTSLEQRLQGEQKNVIRKLGSGGSREMTFSLKKKRSRKEEMGRRAAHAHHEERKKLRRSAGGIVSKLPPKFRKITNLQR